MNQEKNNLDSTKKENTKKEDDFQKTEISHQSSSEDNIFENLSSTSDTPIEKEVLNEIENFLSENTPDFSKMYEDIQNDLNDSSVDIDPLDIKHAFQKEENLQKKNKIDLNPIKKGKRFFLTRYLFLIFAYLISFFSLIFYKIPKKVINFLFGSFRLVIIFIQDFWEKISYLSFHKKILFFIGLIGVFFFFYFFYLMIIERFILKNNKQYFLTSYKSVADAEYTYDSKVELENFYKSIRFDDNILLLKKIMINLKSSLNSGENPMGMFEFYVVGYSAGPLQEIKENQARFLHFIRKDLERLSFDQINNNRNILNQKITGNINKILTKGKIKKVLIRNMVLKP